jgi:CHAD domain-containing protein
MAGFEGQLRMLAAPDGVQVAVLAGTLRAAAADFACCRMELAGPETAVAGLAALLAGRLPLHVPAASLGAVALTVAGRPMKSRRHPPPVLPPDRPVGEAFALLVAQLTAVILFEAPHAGPAESEPVHQMRVAVRRLRSAAGLFSRAVHCPELTACKAELRTLAKALGPTRDWDVFVAGAGRAVAANFAEDRAVRRLLVAAERRRIAAYAALQAHLDSPEFRRLGIALAVLATSRPWEAVLEAVPLAGEDEAAARQAERLAGPLDGFAARALERRLRPLREPGADIESLPPAALHGLRLHGKRLRYACEFFAPLFPGRGARRFIRRLSVLQERLGHLNDGAVAAGLMAELGAARGYAGGVVRGFVAAQAAGARFRIGRSWRKFHRLDPFWD